MMPEKSENIHNNHLVAELLSLELPSKDYAIFGSAPIAAHGLMDFSEVADLDLIARGEAWEMAKTLSKEPPVETELKFGEVLTFFKRGDEYDISIYTGWPHGNWNIDELIESADVIDGIRFVSLDNVLKWKKARNRPKDAHQIELLEKHFQSKSRG